MSAVHPTTSGRAPVSLMVRIRLIFAGIVGAGSGIAPHILHHAGPIAGAAVVSGATGTVVFGVAGFVLMIPSLLRIKRHFNSWIAPGAAMLVFAAVFTVSTVWIGPIIRGDTSPAPDAHAPEHDAHGTPAPAGGR